MLILIVKKKALSRNFVFNRILSLNAFSLVLLFYAFVISSLLLTNCNVILNFFYAWWKIFMFILFFFWFLIVLFIFRYFILFCIKNKLILFNYQFFKSLALIIYQTSSIRLAFWKALIFLFTQIVTTIVIIRIASNRL